MKLKVFFFSITILWILAQIIYIYKTDDVQAIFIVGNAVLGFILLFLCWIDDLDDRE